MAVMGDWVALWASARSIAQWLTWATGDFSAEFYVMATCCLLSAIVSLFWLNIPRQATARGPVAAQ
jgi:hypothetical protein